MANYYFVASALPALRMEEAPEIRFEDFLTLLRANLYPQDYRQVESILQLIDFQNLCSYWRNQPLDNRGTKTFSDIEESLSTMTGFEDYVFDFLNRYENKADLLKNFSQLLVAYFHEVISQTTGFLQQYFTFEREWRLVMLALRAKQLSRDVTLELQYEDPHDLLVGQILAQRDVPNYEPPDQYRDLLPLFEENREDPVALQKALQVYRFNKIDSFIEGTPLFSLDYILAYTIQLIIIENFQELGAKT